MTSVEKETAFLVSRCKQPRFPITAMKFQVKHRLNVNRSIDTVGKGHSLQ